MNPAEVFRMKPADAKSLMDTLSPRELDVAQLMAMGLSNRAIAEKVGISRKTLDIHRGNVKKKFGTTVNGIGRVVFAAKFANG